MSQSERSKTNFLIEQDLIEQLRKIPTTPEFLGSKFPVYAYLTKLVNKRDVHKEIARLYTRDIDEFGDKESGIGYQQTENTFGYVKKDGTSFKFYLTPYHKATLQSFK